MAGRILPLLFWCAVALWVGGIMRLSSTPARELPEAAFILPDKLSHFAAFAVGGWLTASALRLSRPRAALALRLGLAITFVAALGALDEALQTFIPGRTGGDLYDWIADFLGAVAGASSSLFTHAFLERFIARP